MTLAIIGILADILLVLGAWVYLAFAAPRILQSMTRYRLWKLRDQVTDQILLGDLGESELARDAVESIESGIKFTPHMTLLNVAFLPNPPTKWLEDRANFMKKQSCLHTEDQFRRLTGAIVYFRRIVIEHCTLYSISGWALVFPAIIAVVCKLLWHYFQIGTSRWVKRIYDCILPEDRLVYRYQDDNGMPPILTA